MASFSLGGFGRGIARVWGWVDGTRRLLFNLIFLAIVVAVVASFWRSGPPALQDKTALVLGLAGPLVEQRSGSARESVLAQVQGNESPQTQLRDLIAVLDAAAKDPKITHAILSLDEFQGGGLAALREAAAALQRFRASGKPLVAWASTYDQRQYLLAAQANEVWLHPMGAVYIDGFGRYRNYYREALDKLGVTANLIKVGTYKSAAEPYVASGPSEAAAEADKFLINGLWAQYTADLEKARGWQPGTLMKAIDALPGSLVAVGGDAGKLALATKQVDALMTRDQMREQMIKRGAPDHSDPKRPTFQQVSMAQYLSRLKPAAPGAGVGVIVAAGEISDGNEPAGRIGGKSTAELVRQARNDDQVKAVVLRVDSPGGSAFGSELVRRELELTRAAGKPVVVSMGSVAASGGYWISMAADEVIADPATVTGSIGVFALLPSADKALDKLGVRTAGSPSTWLGGAGDVRRPMDPRFAELIQAYVGRIYTDFTTLAAQARKTTPEKINEVAQGRVWTGTQALERGLIDRVGSYTDALKAAATRAKLAEDAPVRYIEREPSRFERLSALIGGGMARVLAEQFDLAVVPAGLPAGALTDARRELGWLAGLATREAGATPFVAVTHCLCEAR